MATDIPDPSSNRRWQQAGRVLFRDRRLVRRLSDCLGVSISLRFLGLSAFLDLSVLPAAPWKALDWCQAGLECLFSSEQRRGPGDGGHTWSFVSSDIL
jgi:hypothetical protein